MQIRHMLKIMCLKDFPINSISCQRSNLRRFHLSLNNVFVVCCRIAFLYILFSIVLQFTLIYKNYCKITMILLIPRNILSVNLNTQNKFLCKNVPNFKHDIFLNRIKLLQLNLSLLYTVPVFHFIYEDIHLTY